MDSRRSLLEPMKYLAPREVLLRAALVCKHWEEVTGSEELWRVFCSVEDFSGSSLTRSWKDVFRQAIIARGFLPLVWRNSLAFYDCKEGEIRPTLMLAKPVQAAEGSSVCFIPGLRVLICGGGTVRQSLSSAAVICPFTGDVDSVRSMRERRMSHGIAQFQRFVFVFGGLHSLTSKKSVEAYSLENNLWTPVGNMNDPRTSFQPCVLKSCIYLCGGYSNTAEVFRPSEGSFTLLSLTLPEASRACTVLYHNELLVITRAYISRISDQECERKSMYAQLYDSSGDCPALAVNEEVYFPIARWSQVVRLRADTHHWSWELMRIKIGK